MRYNFVPSMLDAIRFQFSDVFNESILDESKDWGGKYQYFLQQKGVDSFEAEKKAFIFIDSFEKFLKENNLKESPDGTWIMKNILGGNIRWPEDSENVIELLADFNKAKKSANFNAQKDLLQYKKFPELWAVVNNYYKRDEGTSDDILKMPGVTFLNSQKDLKLYEISDAKTMSEIANRGSGWCVKDLNTAKDYLKKGPFELVTKAGKNYVLAHPGSDQIKNFSDDTISFEIAEEIFGLIKAFLPKVPSEDYFVFLNFYPERVQVAAVKRNGDAIRYLKNPSKEVQFAVVQNNGYAIKYLKNTSEEVQIAAVRKYGDAIKYLENPSEKVQLAAVQNSTDAIIHLENPSEEVQIAAVKQDGYAIQYLENPSEEVQLVAVKQNGLAIVYLKNPSEEVKLAAVQNSAYAIRYLKNPAEKVQLAAVQNNGLAIRYLKNPTEEAQIVAVRQNGLAIQFLKNTSEKVQIAAVQEDGLIIQYLKNPSEKVKLAAVKQNGDAIKYLKNPSEKVQIAAVQEDGLIIQYLKNPSEKVKLAAVKQNGDAIKYLKNPSEEAKLAAKKQSGSVIEHIKNPSKFQSFDTFNEIKIDHPDPTNKDSAPNLATGQEIDQALEASIDATDLKTWKPLFNGQKITVGFSFRDGLIKRVSPDLKYALSNQDLQKMIPIMGFKFASGAQIYVMLSNKFITLDSEGGGVTLDSMPDDLWLHYLIPKLDKKGRVSKDVEDINSFTQETVVVHFSEIKDIYQVLFALGSHSKDKDGYPNGFAAFYDFDPLNFMLKEQVFGGKEKVTEDFMKFSAGSLFITKKTKTAGLQAARKKVDEGEAAPTIIQIPNFMLSGPMRSSTNVSNYLQDAVVRALKKQEFIDPAQAGVISSYFPDQKTLITLSYWIWFIRKLRGQTGAVPDFLKVKDVKKIDFSKYELEDSIFKSNPSEILATYIKMYDSEFEGKSAKKGNFSSQFQNMLDLLILAFIRKSADIPVAYGRTNKVSKGFKIADPKFFTEMEDEDFKQFKYLLAKVFGSFAVDGQTEKEIITRFRTEDKLDLNILGEPLTPDELTKKEASTTSETPNSEASATPKDAV